MTLNQSLIAELQHEAAVSKKVLERAPETSYGWKPHPKSMSLGRLATHVAELPRFITRALTTEGMDFATMNYTPLEAANKAELFELFNSSLTDAIAALQQAQEEVFKNIWTMRSGETIIAQLPVSVIIRNLGLSHLIHHRGQLSVYLRLLEVPVPPIYGPSADEGPKLVPAREG